MIADPIVILMCLFLGSYLSIETTYLYVQRWLTNDMLNAERENAVRRAMLIQQDAGEQRHMMQALKQELEITNISRHDLLHYIEKMEVIWGHDHK